MYNKFIDMAGQKFGRLTVVKFTHVDKAGNRHWECLCECGKTSNPTTGGLTKGHSKSCGCLRTEHIIASVKVPDPGFRGLLQCYQIHAKERNLEWCLTDEQFRVLTSSPCYYTGRVPSQEFISSHSHYRRRKYALPPNSGGVYVYNGVDRLDSAVGYTLENCVPACKDANLAKQSLSEAEFIQLCKEVAQHHQV